MMRILVILSLALFSSVALHSQGASASDQPPGKSLTKESSADPEQTQTARAFIESRLSGKVVKVEKDPSDLLRAVLEIERDGSISRHVLEAALDSDRNLREVRIVTTEERSPGVSPVIIIPPALTSKCWEDCTKKCGGGTECRVRCLFDCIAAT